ncbi:hypothetical protein [Novosphingobium sp.]|uniref:hypothetical protein n=1 Tax=Novosphingobium sp. TaxID=1874826 RepID=UPI0038B78CE3
MPVAFRPRLIAAIGTSLLAQAIAGLPVAALAAQTTAPGAAPTSRPVAPVAKPAAPKPVAPKPGAASAAVSYTHLTLPTIA